MNHSDQAIEPLLQAGYRYALSLTHHHYEAEDLVQEAWMRLWSQKGKMPDQSLLFTAIRNLFIDRCRRANIVVFESVEEDALGGDGKTHVPGGALDLDIILAGLRTEEREALFLNVVEGYSASEIAEQTKCSRNTVLSLIHRAKQRVADRLRLRSETDPNYSPSPKGKQDG